MIEAPFALACVVSVALVGACAIILAMRNAQLRRQVEDRDTEIILLRHQVRQLGLPVDEFIHPLRTATWPLDNR